MGDFGRFGRESVVTRLSGEESASTPPGATVGEKYEVAARIGAGGMGEVLLVQDRDLRRQVAMKVPRKELAASKTHRERFVAEAQATSQLDHPGVPPVHDMGITPDGQVYFTMKLVRGRTLREVLHHLLLNRKEVREVYEAARRWASWGLGASPRPPTCPI